MRKAWLTPVMAALIFPTTLLADDEVQWSTSAAINFKTGEYVPKADPDTGFKFKNTTLDLAMTLAVNRFFMTVNYDTTLKEDYTVTNRGTIEVETTRLDEGVTVGADVYRGLNAFLGYKVGETEQKTVRTTGTTARIVSYYDKGPFVGIGYGHNFRSAGTLSASVAYARLKGDISLINQITEVMQHTGGDTSGLSYGIKWSKDLQSGTTLSIGFKKNKYKFVDKDLGFGTSQDLKQDFDILYLQATSYFN